MLLALCSEGMASFSVCMIEKFVRMERKTVNFKQSFISPRNELTLANPKGCIFGGEPELGTNCVYIYTARSFLFGTSGKSFFFWSSYLLGCKFKLLLCFRKARFLVLFSKKSQHFKMLFMCFKVSSLLLCSFSLEPPR